MLTKIKFMTAKPLIKIKKFFNSNMRVKRIVLFALYVPLIMVSLEILNGMKLFNNIPAVIFTYLFIALLYALVFSIIGHVAVSVSVVNIGLFLIYLLNYYRFLLSSMPFMPADFAMASKMNDIMSFNKISIKPEAVLSAALVIALTIVFCVLFGGLKVNYRKRLISFSSSLIVFMLVFVSSQYQTVFGNPLSKGVAERYSDYGVALGFFMTSQTMGVKTEAVIDYLESPSPGVTASSEWKTTAAAANNPTETAIAAAALPGADLPDFLVGNPAYSKDLMDQITDYVKSNYVSESSASDVKPNVIVIMSEAFSDPALWPNITFSQDPAPNLHKLQNSSSAVTGDTITPVFGGGTCDAEYEVLTGNSMYFVNSGDTPYTNNYITEPDPRSLVNVFNDNGYNTVAVHTYYKNAIYPRDVIYPLLGFDSFISEEDMPDATYKGTLPGSPGEPGVNLISDDYLTDVIIDQLNKTEESNKDKDVKEPLFLFSVSMENHWSYFRGKYPDDEIDVRVTSDKLTDTEVGYAEAYLQGIHDADAALGKLIDYIQKNVTTPTIVFFFGDHKPLIGESRNTFFESLGYLKVGDIDKWTFDERVEMFRTPYVLWANYELPEDKIADMGDISDFFIGAKLLDIAGVNKNLYFSFLTAAYTQFDAITTGNNYGGFFENKAGEAYPKPTSDCRTTLEILNRIEFDALYGNKYAYGELSKLTGS